jgi:hypothetical protein
MLNTHIGYCHTHRSWTLVDTDTSHFVCGELAVWDVPRASYISVDQLESEMPRMPGHRLPGFRMHPLVRSLAS